MEVNFTFVNADEKDWETDSYQTLQIIWTVLTFCLSRCNSANQVYALRFIVGKAFQYILELWDHMFFNSEY